MSIREKEFVLFGTQFTLYKDSVWVFLHVLWQTKFCSLYMFNLNFKLILLLSKFALGNWLRETFRWKLILFIYFLRRLVLIGFTNFRLAHHWVLFMGCIAEWLAVYGRTFFHWHYTFGYSNDPIAMFTCCLYCVLWRYMCGKWMATIILPLRLLFAISCTFGTCMIIALPDAVLCGQQYFNPLAHWKAFQFKSLLGNMCCVRTSKWSKHWPCAFVLIIPLLDRTIIARCHRFD